MTNRFFKLENQFDNAAVDYLFESLDQFNLPDLLQKREVLVSDIFTIHKIISDYTFETIDEEIYFFKTLKPAYIEKFIVLSWLITYHSKLFFSEQDRSKYLLKFKKKAIKFLHKKEAFVCYLKQNSTDLDTQYFCRIKTISQFTSLEEINWSTNCVSSHGFIKAKITAYEIILGLIDAHFYVFAQSEWLNNPPISLVWTHPKIDLIELLYALQETKAINNGSTNIKYIALAFDQLFTTNLATTIHRDFVDIKRRKLGTTKFLNKLQKVLQQSVDEKAML